MKIPVYCNKCDSVFLEEIDIANNYLNLLDDFYINSKCKNYDCDGELYIQKGKYYQVNPSLVIYQFPNSEETIEYHFNNLESLYSNRKSSIFASIEARYYNYNPTHELRDPANENLKTEDKNISLWKKVVAIFATAGTILAPIGTVYTISKDIGTTYQHDDSTKEKNSEIEILEGEYRILNEENHDLREKLNDVDKKLDDLENKSLNNEEETK